MFLWFGHYLLVIDKRKNIAMTNHKSMHCTDFRILHRSSCHERTLCYFSVIYLRLFIYSYLYIFGVQGHPILLKTILIYGACIVRRYIDCCIVLTSWVKVATFIIHMSALLLLECQHGRITRATTASSSGGSTRALLWAIIFSQWKQQLAACRSGAEIALSSNAHRSQRRQVLPGNFSLHWQARQYHPSGCNRVPKHPQVFTVAYGAARPWPHSHPRLQPHFVPCWLLHRWATFTVVTW